MILVMFGHGCGSGCTRQECNNSNRQIHAKSGRYASHYQCRKMTNANKIKCIKRLKNSF